VDAGVTALSHGEALAVGTRSYHTAQRTYGEHWDGTSWSRVNRDDPDPKNSRLAGVASTPSGTAFAVGSLGGSGGCKAGTAARSRHSLIERWDGAQWTKVAAPSPRGTTALYGITTVSDSEAWAVGGVSTGGKGLPLALHWDGATWQRVAMQRPRGSVGAVFGVDAAASNDAWAVGYSYHGSNIASYVVHWDGSSWTIV
jgi:hypothetical protein